MQTFCELRRDNGPRETKEGWIADSVADKDIDARMIGHAAKDGDPIAVKTWEVVADQLGLAMANSVTFSAPQAIFMMGGPTRVGDLLMIPLRKAFEKYLLNIYAGSCEIRMSQLKANEVAILGAAALINMKK